MKTTNYTLAILPLLPLVLAANAQPLRIDGSAAGAAISKMAAAEFRKQDKAAAVVVGITGSGGGLTKLCRGEADLVTVTRPIQKDEMTACEANKVEFVEVPIAFDAVAIIVNPKNAFVDRLSMEDLRKIWDISSQGEVIRWNQVNAAWPDAPLKLLAPDALSDDSRYFNAAVLGGRPARGDYMASTEERVLVRGTARDPYALSYVSLGTYLEHRGQVKAVPIAQKTGGPAVAPTVETVSGGAYKPLSRPLFLYVSVKALEGATVHAFAEHYVLNGARWAKAAHFVPLPPQTYELGLSHLRKRTRGSAWAGTVPLGLSAEELQKKQSLL